ncbi:MAG: hypothetical protein PHQ09_04965 [Actinomycetota bacterium]|nr:hypothetical protein [Actinomycetota bacterium]
MSRDKIDDKTKNDYPEYIYESFMDKDGNEVVIEMERKTGTLNDENIIFYEDTNDSQVIYCHFYQGILKDVDSEKIVFLVDKECKNADLSSSFNDYKDVEDYEIKFFLSDYNTEHNEEFGIRDMISINTIEIKGYKDFEKLVNKYLKVIDTVFKENTTNILVKGLDFFIR